MVCPKCKAEYRRGFTQCSDCDIALVDGLIEPDLDHGDPDSSSPVELARFLDVHQAEFAVSVLAGSGIPAFIDQAFTGNIAPYIMLGSGGIRLLVRQEDRQRALEVLQSSEELDPIDEPNSDV